MEIKALILVPFQKEKTYSKSEQSDSKSAIKQNCGKLAKVTKVQHSCIATSYSEMYPW